MKKLGYLVIAFGVFSVPGFFAWADTLELKGRASDRRAIYGWYSTNDPVQSENRILVYPVKDVLALTFSATEAVLPTPTPSLSGRSEKIPSKPQFRPHELVLTPGTPLSVSMLDTIDVNTNKREDGLAEC